MRGGLAETKAVGLGAAGGAQVRGAAHREPGAPLHFPRTEGPAAKASTLGTAQGLKLFSQANEFQVPTEDASRFIITSEEEGVGVSLLNSP